MEPVSLVSIIILQICPKLISVIEKVFAKRNETSSAERRAVRRAVRLKAMIDTLLPELKEIEKGGGGGGINLKKLRKQLEDCHRLLKKFSKMEAGDFQLKGETVEGFLWDLQSAILGLIIARQGQIIAKQGQMAKDVKEMKLRLAELEDRKKMEKKEDAKKMKPRLADKKEDGKKMEKKEDAKKKEDGKKMEKKEDAKKMEKKEDAKKKEDGKKMEKKEDAKKKEDGKNMEKKEDAKKMKPRLVENKDGRQAKLRAGP